MSLPRQKSPDLSVNVAGLKLRNPVIAASGTYGYGTEYRSLAPVKLFGAIVIKTVTLMPRAGNPPPRICETPSGMLNSIGLANVGIDCLLREKMPALKSAGIPVIVNIAGSSVPEYAQLARRLGDRSDVAAIELNISCPNVKQGGVAFGSEPRIAAALTRAVRKATSKPLIVKLSPNVTDVTVIARAVRDAGADALSLINTLYGMAIDIERQRPVLGNVTGGLSGPAIRPVALYYVYKVCRAVSIPVIGIGGIASAEDAVQFLLAGAAAVQIGTATFVDPRSVSNIVTGLTEYCKDKGYRTVREIIGRLNT